MWYTWSAFKWTACGCVYVYSTVVSFLDVLLCLSFFPSSTTKFPPQVQASNLSVIQLNQKHHVCLLASNHKGFVLLVDGVMYIGRIQLCSVCTCTCGLVGGNIIETNRDTWPIVSHSQTCMFVSHICINTKEVIEIFWSLIM